MPEADDTMPAPPATGNDSRLQPRDRPAGERAIAAAAAMAEAIARAPSRQDAAQAGARGLVALADHMAFAPARDALLFAAHQMRTKAAPPLRVIEGGRAGA